MEPKIKPSDLDREAQRLHKQGEMPSLHELLSAIAETRAKFHDKVIAARNEEHPGAKALEGK